MTKRNSTALITLMGWQVGSTAGPKGKRKITSVILSDGETELPFTEQLHRDIEALEDKLLAEAQAGQGPVSHLRHAG